MDILAPPNWRGTGEARIFRFFRRRPQIDDLVEKYMDHCLSYYRSPDGTPTRTVESIRAVLRYLTKDYGSLPASRFTPRMLKDFQRKLIESGLARTTINGYVGDVKKLFQWGVSEQMVDPMAHHALTTVKNLKRGRSLAREPKPIRPVPERDIEAVECYLSRTFWNLLCLQRLTGARSGEISSLRGINIDQSDKIWVMELRSHKNTHHDLPRLVFFGGQSQAILKPMLVKALPTQYLFSPDCGLNPYHRASYAEAVRKACDLAGIDRWTPHQLRHTSGTMVRKRFGLEAARAHLGHARIASTEIYAEMNYDLAYKIAEEIG